MRPAFGRNNVRLNAAGSAVDDLSITQIDTDVGRVALFIMITPLYFAAVILDGKKPRARGDLRGIGDFVLFTERFPPHMIGSTPIQGEPAIFQHLFNKRLAIKLFVGNAQVIAGPGLFHKFFSSNQKITPQSERGGAHVRTGHTAALPGLVYGRASPTVIIG